MKTLYNKLFMLVLLFSFLGIGVLTAQHVEDLPGVIVKGTVKDGAIKLRWAVNDKTAWKLGNQYGYYIERTTVLRDGQPLQSPEKKRLTGAAIRPKPLAEWEILVQNNDMAAVAAQAIYGDDFNVNDENSNAAMQVIYQSEELDRRFAFALFAIDQSFEAAQYAGLGYVDTDVKPNEKYLYTIKPAIPMERMTVKEHGVFISPSEEEELPTPMDFVGYYYKDAFVLIWEYDALQEYYTTYDLERSDDGVNFKAINQVPITKLAEAKRSGISYTDSVTTYSKKYWYRVVGRTTFGDKSPPSKAAEVIAIKELQAAAVFTETKIPTGDYVELSWEYPGQEQWKVKKFQMLRANKVEGPYKVIEDSIAPSVRTYTYSDILPISYFKLNTIGQGGDALLSSPTMVQPVDSIPPKQPIGLSGTIDSLGVVRLSWTPNKELDLQGYKIYRTDSKQQTFIGLNKDFSLATTFTDSVSLKNMAKKVYYKIAAIDHRHNASPFSDTLALVKPDKIPPSSPVFNGYKIKEDGVVLNWTKSSSEDVTLERIYRKQPGSDSPWEKLFETPSNTLSTFTDTTIEANTRYSYTILAVDQGNLESLPSPPITINATKALHTKGVKGLYAAVDRTNRWVQLSWRIVTETPILEIQIYKKKALEPYRLFKTVKGTTKLLVDDAIAPGNTYSYGVKIVFTNGTFSQWEEIDVEY